MSDFVFILCKVWVIKINIHIQCIYKNDDMTENLSLMKRAEGRGLEDCEWRNFYNFFFGSVNFGLNPGHF